MESKRKLFNCADHETENRSSEITTQLTFDKETKKKMSDNYIRSSKI